jgi:hypothetical protein
MIAWGQSRSISGSNNARLGPLALFEYWHIFFQKKYANIRVPLCDLWANHTGQNFGNFALPLRL